MTPIEEKRNEIIATLKAQFGLTDSACDRILFLNPRDLYEPWIPADVLQAIARQIDGFKGSSVTHDKFVSETQQVVYKATVFDIQGGSYTRTGVATVGEKPNNFDIPHDSLAEGRALGAALSAAGFHPYKSASVVDLSEARTVIEQRRQQAEYTGIEDEAELRKKDLRQIHTIAEKKGLIIGKDDSEYRLRLHEEFGTRTAAILDATDRARVINWLNQLPDWSDVPIEYREDALVA